MSDPLKDSDPEDLRNVVLELKRRIDALEQGFVSAKSADDILEEVSGVAVTFTTNGPGESAPLRWKNLLDELTGFIDSFEDGASASGFVVAGVKTSGAAKGLAFLNTYDEDGETILSQVILDTQQLFELRQYVNDPGITQRKSRLPAVGWQPYAYPLAFDMDAAFGGNVALAANGGSIAMAVHVDAPMNLESVSVRNLNGATQRTWGWDLYRQDTNTENSSENTLTRVAQCSANDTFTPGAASVRTITASGEPVYLAPGYYWLVVQCRHATNTFALGMTGIGAPIAGNVSQTKTTTNPNGDTLDFVAATWVKRDQEVYGVRLNGQVFGESTAF
jgi:hypothetical protein